MASWLNPDPETSCQPSTWRIVIRTVKAKPDCTVSRRNIPLAYPIGEVHHDTEFSPSSNLLLSADNHTGLRRLMTMIHSPGLIQHRHGLHAYSSESSNNATPTTYVVSVHRLAIFLSLIDRGANGGICGDDLRRISLTDRSINVQGIGNPQLQGLAIRTSGATTRTQRGDVVLIFHQYAYHGRGKSIHSSLQLDDNGVKVNAPPVSLNGEQSLLTDDGYAIPLDFNNGLNYLNLRPFTDDELETQPHVIMTRNMVWSPSRYDDIPSSSDSWFQEQATPSPLHCDFNLFEEHIEANLTEALSPPLLLLLRRTGPTLGTSMFSMSYRKNNFSSKKRTFMLT